MKELVIISGKGGTGKTSIAASFAVLAERPVIADCDVDAADMHLIMRPATQETHPFHSGHMAVIRQEACTQCGACLTHCRFDAVQRDAPESISNTSLSECNNCDYCKRSCDTRTNAIIREIQESSGEYQHEYYTIDPAACEGCGVCVRYCPANAIDFPDRLCGEWMVSSTRSGPMVHARLGAAAENSGKLVSLVRREARRIADNDHHPIIIVDGPPGIGCPVIASITGASLVLAITEPTVSGEHDLNRVLSLAGHFKIPAVVCVNKWDLNPEMADRIETTARKGGARVLSRIRYDPAVTRAQLRELSIVEMDAPAAADVRKVFTGTMDLLEIPTTHVSI